MNEKWTYFFVGLIVSTIIYVGIILAIVFIDSNKKEEIDVSLIKEAGTFICDNFSNVKNTFDNNIVINDGYMYNINLDMKYSNEQNCIKMSDKKIVKVIDNYYVTDENTLYTPDKNGGKEFDSKGKVPEYLMDESVLMASNYGNNGEYKYYVLKNDGKIYDVTFTREFYFENGEGLYRFDVLSEEVYLEYNDEIIKTFDVEDNKIIYVNTDKGIYTEKVTNSECNMYADIDCIYSLTKNDILEENMSNISYINLCDKEVKYINLDKKIYKFEV